MCETCVDFLDELKERYEEQGPLDKNVFRATAILGGVLVGLFLRKSKAALSVAVLLFVIGLLYTFYRLFLDSAYEEDEDDWDWDEDEEEEEEEEEETDFQD